MPPIAKKSSPASTASASRQDAPASFEAAMQELEALAEGMEAEAQPLDVMLVDYRRAAYLLGHCREHLRAVEQQVKVIDGMNSSHQIAEGGL